MVIYRPSNEFLFCRTHHFDSPRPTGKCTTQEDYQSLLKPCRPCLFPVQPSFVDTAPHVGLNIMHRMTLGNHVVRFMAHYVKHVVAFLYPVLTSVIGEGVRDLTEARIALQDFRICE